MESLFHFFLKLSYNISAATDNHCSHLFVGVVAVLSWDLGMSGRTELKQSFLSSRKWNRP